MQCLTRKVRRVSSLVYPEGRQFQLPVLPFLLIPSSIRSSLCHFVLSPYMLEFLDDHSGNNGDVVGIWLIPVSMTTSGASDHSPVMPKNSAAPLPMDYLVVLFIKCFDRLVYWELSNGKAFEGWMLVRRYYIKSTTENQTAWLQRGLAGIN